MDIALLAARVVLAGVFVVAGVAKLADIETARRTLREFGAPDALARVGGVLLPFVEVAVALALLPVISAWWGAAGALALLILFLGAIGVNLARGRRPDCRCFGELAAQPIGAATVVRNVVLATIAVFILAPGPGSSGASLTAWLGDLSTVERAGVGLGVVIALMLGALTWLQLEMLRQQGRLLLRLDDVEARLDGRFIGGADPVHHHAPGTAHMNGHAESPPMGLPIGAPAPDLSLPDLAGEQWTLDRLIAAGRTTMLLFVDPNCGPCASLLPDVHSWQREHGDRLTLAVVSRGSQAENRRKLAGLDPGPVLLQQDYEVADRYQVTGTPAAVLVDAGGSIASPLVAGPDAVRSLVARTVDGAAPADIVLNGVAHHGHAHQPEPGLPLGSPAPPIELPDLDGIVTRLSDLSDRMKLLVFWNPGCGFCRQLLPDLKAWEADPPPRAPELVLVAAGPAEENRAVALRSTVLLDGTGATAQAYQAGGTPMAVLVDGEGRIASTLVAGVTGVLALLGGRPRQVAP
jgi:thiol-disulfide isomerase/thioredoxin